MRSVDAGFRASHDSARVGRSTRLPPQLGQIPFSCSSLHRRQKVHSNEQTNASPESGGKSPPQHSQFGRNSNTRFLLKSQITNHKMSSPRVEKCLSEIRRNEASRSDKHFSTRGRPQNLPAFPPQSLTNLMPKTPNHVIINHPGSLHVRIHNSTTNKLEPPLFQVLA